MGLQDVSNSRKTATGSRGSKQGRLHHQAALVCTKTRLAAAYEEGRWQG